MSEKPFFDQIFDDFYDEVGDDFLSKLKIGQIIWTYCFYNYESLELWRPADLDDSKTRANSFEIVSAPSDAFKRKIPLSFPRLEINEEFLVVRAKRRPAIVVTFSNEEIPISDLRRGGKINQNLALIVPLFSLEDNEGNAKYRPEFVNNVRKLKYPDFFFLPKKKEFLIKDSVCRFDKHRFSRNLISEHKMKPPFLSI